MSNPSVKIYDEKTSDFLCPVDPDDSTETTPSTDMPLALRVLIPRYTDDEPKKSRTLEVVITLKYFVLFFEIEIRQTRGHTKYNIFISIKLTSGIF